MFSHSQFVCNDLKKPLFDFHLAYKPPPRLSAISRLPITAQTPDDRVSGDYVPIPVHPRKARQINWLLSLWRVMGTSNRAQFILKLKLPVTSLPCHCHHQTAPGYQLKPPLPLARCCKLRLPGWVHSFKGWPRTNLHCWIFPNMMTSRPVFLHEPFWKPSSTHTLPSSIRCSPYTTDRAF